MSLFDDDLVENEEFTQKRLKEEEFMSWLVALLSFANTKRCSPKINRISLCGF